MFDPADKNRVFASALGTDFTQTLVDGIRARVPTNDPAAMGQVEVFVNTRRMARRMQELFNQGPPTILPKIRLVTDLVNDPIGHDLPPAVSLLRRKLELSQLISGLLDHQPDLAPRSALFDLSESLSMLMGEMQDEGVTPDTIRGLDITDKSGHWDRSQMFLNIVDRFFGTESGEPPDIATRQRQITELLIEHWKVEPPKHPVLVAGSTGSRGTTALLMHAVTKLPQGAIVLPGFDFDLPNSVWDRLDDPMIGEDHPQFRFAKLLNALDLSPDSVEPWDRVSSPAAPERNRLISLALRPAPVTDQWMVEGPAFEGIDAATKNVSLIEASSSRTEAVAIALILRQAAESGKTAALVTPDQLLTRQVTAALDRWRIEPDASIGDPLLQSAPGRLLRHVAELYGTPLTSEALLTILKHPLVNTGGNTRGDHLRWTRELELKLRRYGPPFPTVDDMVSWAEKTGDNDDRMLWVNWITETVFNLSDSTSHPTPTHIERHLLTTEKLANGHSREISTELWNKESGKEAQKILSEFSQVASYGGDLSPMDYRQLLHSVLSAGEIRDPVLPHPNIMIWGTLEARVQGADLIILGGLNEGVWPELPSPDPWLNRELRLKAGLLLPERRIGLSAHDFQQAVAAKEVVLSRATRDADAQTVASRWINRLTNLISGMSDEGRIALGEIKARGQYWLDLVVQLEKPQALVAQAERPSPRPPISARPTSLSVTAIARLIRDPFAIYASDILGLRKLDSLRQLPDAPLRGTMLHKVLERFIESFDTSISSEAANALLLNITDEVLQAKAPWPAARVLWRAKLARVADVFLRDEYIRQKDAKYLALETQGRQLFADINFTLTGTADRIDMANDGTLRIYDYKTGTVPSVAQLRYFDKQLLLEAMMVEQGAFEKVTAETVSQVAHIGLGSSPKFNRLDLEFDDIPAVRAEFLELIGSYFKHSQGYTSRRAMTKMGYAGDFDHLARFGEWDESQTPNGVDVG